MYVVFCVKTVRVCRVVCLTVMPQASFHQLIICTSKTSVGQAEGYTEYLLNEIKEVC